MELNQYFSVLILLVCAIHLAATLGARIQSWWQELNVGKHPGQFARDAHGLSAKVVGQQRSDWYVFFHCSDLVGKEPTQKSNSSLSQDKVVSEPQIRRPSVRRPENRLTLT